MAEIKRPYTEESMKKYIIDEAIGATDLGSDGCIDKHNTRFEIVGTEEMQVSDGYHTMGELYDHRVTLFIALCRTIQQKTGQDVTWRSRLHADGSSFEGWFILGIYQEKSKQITYHLPLKDWERCNFALTLEKAPEWDGHTSAEVIQRLKQL